MPEFTLRTMTAGDRAEVADLIYISINHWYQVHGAPPIFQGGPAITDVFFQVYEALDPGCAIVAAHNDTGRLMGSCFYHPRPKHVSLGIMNCHPNYFGMGVGSALLQYIIDFAQREEKPLRLTQSALNLDSFSLYNKAGFVPRCAFQDMYLAVPDGGLGISPDREIRVATNDDVAAMSALEFDVSAITREQDYAYCIANDDGFWDVAVAPGEQGLDGFLISCSHSAMNMLGPCVARDEATAAALLLHALDQQRGRSPVFLVPVECDWLVKQAYSWGARNCELHFCQVLGDFKPFQGVSMPTFLPETG